MRRQPVWVEALVVRHASAGAGAGGDSGAARGEVAVLLRAELAPDIWS